MKRILTAILCLAPVLPALALLALWPRSLFWRTDFMGYSTDRQAIGILSARGMLRVEHFNYPFDSPCFKNESRPAEPADFWSTEFPQVRGPLAPLRIGTRSITSSSTGPPRNPALALHPPLGRRPDRRGPDAADPAAAPPPHPPTPPVPRPLRGVRL